MDEKLYKAIDFIVLLLIENGVVSENKQSTNLYLKALRFLKSKEFIKPTNQRSQYQATSAIYDIHKVGIKEYLKEDDRIKSLGLEIKELTVKNLNLQNEASEYQREIRDKEEQIRDLTRDNLRLNNWDIRFRWLIAIGTFIIGFIAKHFIDK